MPPGSLVMAISGSPLANTLDEAVPVAFASNVIASYDSNLLVNRVTHTISFIRGNDQALGYMTDVIGYNLYLLHIDGSQTFVMNMTLDELGGNSNEMVENGLTSDEIQDIINHNKFQGLAAKAKYAMWRKV